MTGARMTVASSDHGRRVRAIASVIACEPAHVPSTPAQHNESSTSRRLKPNLASAPSSRSCDDTKPRLALSRR